MQHTIITYPQRPPTCNLLTSTERQQLQRTTQKLEKVLGTTPQLVDYNYTVHVDLPPRSRLSRSLSLRSSHSRASSLDHYRPLSPADSISNASVDESLNTRRALSPTGQHHHPKRYSNSSKSPSQPCLAVTSSVPSQTLPLGGCASRPSVDTIFTNSSSSSASFHSSTDRLLLPLPPSRSYSISIPPTRRPSSFVQEDEPQFRVKSDASVRRQKMERVRKTLGECVPIEAVFPDEDKDEVQVRNVKCSAKFSSLDAVYEHPDGFREQTLAPGLRSPAQSHKPTISGSWGRKAFKSIQKAGR